jgi:hypothetical protein
MVSMACDLPDGIAVREGMRRLGSTRVKPTLPAPLPLLDHDLEILAWDDEAGAAAAIELREQCEHVALEERAAIAQRHERAVERTVEGSEHLEPMLRREIPESEMARRRDDRGGTGTEQLAQPLLGSPVPAECTCR